jgi:cyclic beta-1,2-glucan synthetase
MVEPRAAVSNFAHLARLGACGRYGFYEALDYTRSRLPEGAGLAIVRAFMAHHQGMTLVAIANVLFDGRMRGRFHADPRIQAAELLLQEPTPRDLMITRPRAEEVQQADRAQSLQPPELRRVSVTNTRTPQAHVLSNGRYSVMLTSAGGGYSRWQGLAITRWREDPTRDNAGSWLYLRDVASGAVWSATYQPCGVEPTAYAVTFTEDRVEYVRRDGTLTTTLQVLVSPEHDAEVRRISIVNAGRQARELESTSACELVLAPAASDLAHPAFSKLFIETAYLPHCGALIATRRRREPGEQEIWSAHQLVDGGSREPLEYETDRARFIGRCREDDAPLGVMKGARLSNTTDTVLDAMFALRHRVVVEPGATVNLSFWTMVASSRAELIDLLDKHHDVNSHARAATLAWTQAQAQLMHLGISSEEANLFQHLSGRILNADPGQRPP